MRLHFHNESLDDLILLLHALLEGEHVLARLSAATPSARFVFGRWVAFHGHDLLLQHLDLAIHTLVPVNHSLLGISEALHFAHLRCQLHSDLLGLGCLHLGLALQPLSKLLLLHGLVAQLL